MEEPRVSLLEWVDEILMSNESEGIEFYELADAPSSESGSLLLSVSCELLRSAHAHLAKGEVPDKDLPYVVFRLGETDKPRHWGPEIWNEIDGMHAALAIARDGSVFYWGTWESHHEAQRLPIIGFEDLIAVFRSYKGFYDGEPWKKFSNEVYVFGAPGWKRLNRK